MTDLPRPTNDDHGDQDDQAPLTPERRLMAEGLPDWDLEPPLTLIRRPRA